MARKTEIRYVNFYTMGSTAMQPEIALQPKKRVKLPTPKRQKKLLIHVDPMAVLGVVVAFVLMIAMGVGILRLNNAREEALAMEQYLEALQQENRTLKDTYESGYDLEEIEQIAIAMGMIPISEAQQMQIQVAIPETVEQPTFWEEFRFFLAGLFA